MQGLFGNALRRAAEALRAAPHSWPPPSAPPPPSLAARTFVCSAPRWGIEEFVDTRKPGEYPKAGAHLRSPPPACLPLSSAPGRAWEAIDLRRKSFDDLHKLWFVLLKERNLLVSERAAARTLREKFLNPQRITKVRKSMARIKVVLSERAYENWQASGKGPEELAAAKAIINAL